MSNLANHSGALHHAAINATGNFNQVLMGSMTKLLMAIILGAIALWCAKALLKSLGMGFRPIPRVSPAPLMTNAERRVIVYIERALPQARIHAQVSMGAILKPAPGMDRRTSTITRNRFSSKRLDFVAEDKATGQIIAIIELDDWSHDAGNDNWRDRMTGSAGYRTIRLPNGERHSAQTVKARIHAALYPDTVSTPPQSGISRSM